jgi:N-acetyl-anhydromuramyl-L-alanine amidase AmpD
MRGLEHLCRTHRRLGPGGLLVLGLLLLTPTAHAALFGDNPVDLPIKQFVGTENYSSRNAGVDVDSVVVHTTEGSLAGTLAWLADPVSQVSAHFVIAPNGDLYQMVNSRNKAWHASYYNSRSIGIEMVGYANQPSTWNHANLATLAQVIAWSAVEFDIPVENPAGNAYSYWSNRFNAPGIVAHSQVQPWDKGDPGPYFPWNRVLADTNSVIAAAVPEPTTGLLAAAGLGLLASGRRRRR